MYSPVTGDHAVADNTWLRILQGSFGMPLPAVIAHSGQFSVPLELLGFELLSKRDPNRGYSDGRLVADVSSRHDVDFLLRPEDNPSPSVAEPHRIAGAVFEDPHPDEWWNAVHHKQRMFLFVSDNLTPFLDGDPRDTQQAALMACHVTLCPLVIRAWDDGVGTARPGQ